MEPKYREGETAALLAAQGRGAPLRCPRCGGRVEVTTTPFLGQTPDRDVHCQRCGARGGVEGTETC